MKLGLRELDRLVQESIQEMDSRLVRVREGLPASEVREYASNLFEILERLKAGEAVETGSKETRIKYLEDSDFVEKVWGLRREIEEDSRSGAILRTTTQIFGDEVANFVGHDSAHLAVDYMDVLRYLEMGLLVSVRRVVGSEFVPHFFRVLEQEPEKLYGLASMPLKMLRFLTQKELGEGIETERVNLKALTDRLGLAVAGRYFRVGFDVTERPSNPKGNYILNECEDFEVQHNIGCMSSIIYNFVKNALKKMVPEDKLVEEGFKDNKLRVQIQSYKTPHGSFVISVYDNGSPIDLNRMKFAMRRKIQEEGLENIEFPNRRTEKVFRGWKDNPYALRKLTHQDITDLAFLARLSGADNDDFMSSGMGLYGVKYIVEEMGGQILYGEHYEHGGPIFTVILPRTLPDSYLASSVSSVRTGYLKYRMQKQGGLKRAA